MASPIQHVIVLMLENRSFNHLLAYSGIPGLQGVDTNKTNPGPGGIAVPLNNAAPDVLKTDPGHEFEDVDRQIYRAPRPSTPAPASARITTMDGFVTTGGPEAMGCVDPNHVPIFTTLARQFLVCDNWFSSMPGPTWPNRFFVHAGSSGGLANSPSNLTTIGSMLWSKLGFSFEHGTLYDALELAGKTWRVYHGDHFPQVCAIDTMPAVFVADPDKFRALKHFAADLQGDDVADYTFIEPDYSILSKFANGNSQHPDGALSAGEQLISDVYAALTKSNAWQSSLLFIVYDEHGGFYDQMPPPASKPPGDAPLNVDKAKFPPSPPFAFDQYGIRVPAVVVSPWIKPGTVTHGLYDHTSIIRTVYDVFGLPGQLTNRDAAATSFNPLLQSTVQMTAAPELPKVFIPGPAPLSPAMAPAPVPPTPAPPTGAIDGFTRVAAQIDHAINNYTAAMPTATLQAMVRSVPVAPAIAELPVSPDPSVSLSYLERVAARIDAHRIRQGQGPVK
jgi:phospholipase C